MHITPIWLCLQVVGPTSMGPTSIGPISMAPPTLSPSMSGGQLSSSQNGQPLFTSNNSRGSKARSLTSQEAFAILRVSTLSLPQTLMTSELFTVAMQVVTQNLWARDSIDQIGRELMPPSSLECVERVKFPLKGSEFQALSAQEGLATCPCFACVVVWIQHACMCVKTAVLCPRAGPGSVLIHPCCCAERRPAGSAACGPKESASIRLEVHCASAYLTGTPRHKVPEEWDLAGCSSGIGARSRCFTGSMLASRRSDKLRWLHPSAM